MGTWYDLTPDDWVRVHVYAPASKSNRPDLADVEIGHEPEVILLWLPAEYQAWNKAGDQLEV